MRAYELRRGIVIVGESDPCVDLSHDIVDHLREKQSVGC